MSLPPSWILASTVFVAFMCAAIWSDATEGRLPNSLTMAALLSGLAFRLLTGPETVLAGVGGVLLGTAVCLPLFALGAIAGGDLKLVASVGAFLGPRDLVWALLLGAALGLLVAMEEVVRRRVAISVLYRTRDLLFHLATLGRMGRRPSVGSAGAVTVPYGVAIAAGAIAAWFLPLAEVLR